MPEMTEHSREGFEALVQFLESDGWNPTVDRDELTCTMNYQGENGRFAVLARIAGELDHLIFRAQAPMTVPERHRATVAEFLTRANFGLHLGAFEMDWRDGEVRFKTSLDFEELVLTPKLLHNHLYPAVESMDTYFMGLMAVASGAKSPQQAIQDVEEG